jgi:hypothetical protein
MYDAFLNKGLQGAVDGYPVEFGAALVFNIGMRQRQVFFSCCQ